MSGFHRVCWLAMAVGVLGIVDESRADDELSFNRDIRPILSENCFQCHGPDPKTREADLRLDTREGATADHDGAKAIVPGDAAASGLIARITSTDPDAKMPPAESGKRLTESQIEILKKWIAGGANYQRHWSFEPVVRPRMPAVKQTDWPQSPIDHFILSRLESHGLAPSQEADRYTLIRRVYLDLLGLPPTIERADAFANDPRPDAFERMLDAALASPRFGERFARHWLDQARYADSHGYTNDNERVIWPYRDWVIAAFNADLPFDQFTVEQLAGDLLPSATRDQIVATGFHRNTLINTEGGVKADQFRDEQVKDRVDTTGGVWLGLTVGCAKCHTHKYDPITQAEYYQLYAFFNSTADNNSETPIIKAPSAEQERRLNDFAARHANLQKQLDENPGRAERQAAWEQSLVAAAQAAAAENNGNPAADDSMWTVLEIEAKSKQDATFEKLEDKSVLASGANVAADEYQATGLSPLTEIRSVRIEALKHESLPMGGPGRTGNGNFVLSEFWFRTGDGRELRFAKAGADHSQPNYDVAAAIDGKTTTGWAINSAPEGGANHDRTAWFVLPTPLVVEKDHALTFTMQFDNGTAPYNLGRVRISISSAEWIDKPSTGDLAKLAAIPAEQRSPPQKQRLELAFLKADPQLAAIHTELQNVARQRDELTAAVPTTMVMKELDKPRPAAVQVRGDFLRLGEPVVPDVPSVFPGLIRAAGDGTNGIDGKDENGESAAGNAARTRRDLANWLTRPDHPLTARVRVNRVWMQLFGTGLVETENDFGTQGSQPTHPELLDWLADEFVRQAWSTKQLVREIVRSATYRQASLVPPANSPVTRIDPRNLLLSRQNRVRVEAEIVRDLALAASGLLSDKIGGPGVFPPQPEGVYAFTQREKNWRVSTGEDRFRRGMYTFFYRSAPFPLLTTFDAPTFNQTCTRRDRSNTPLQSLTVANDAAMFEIVQALAGRRGDGIDGKNGNQDSYNSHSPDANTIATLFRRCFTRPPQPAERDALLRFLADQRQHFEINPAAAKSIAPANLPPGTDAAEAAAWVATARVLLNLDEFITRE